MGRKKDMSYADDEGVNRPKLSLQPRGSTADNMSSASAAKTSRVSVRSFLRLRSVIFDSGVLPEKTSDDVIYMCLSVVVWFCMLGP